MSERITISHPVDAPEIVDIRLNETGRQRLIAELQALNEQSDHFHMFTEDWGSDELRNRPYEPGDQVVHHLKVHYRPDSWDREYCPHVLPNEEAADGAAQPTDPDQ